MLISKAISAALGFAFLLLGPVSCIAQSFKSEETTLIVTLTSDKKEYLLADDIYLDVRVANASRSQMTVYGKLLWGYAGGLILHVYDALNHEVPAKMLDDDLIVPSALADCHSFVVLNRDHYLGTTRIDHLTDLVHKTGKYLMQVEYLSPVPSKFSRGPNFWSRDKPSIMSNKIEVLVSKE